MSHNYTTDPLIDTNAAIPVGKIAVTTTFLGQNENGDISVDVCARLSFPHLYNTDHSSSYPITPTQRIDVVKTHNEPVTTCCDLYKISKEYLAFHMNIVLSNSERSHEVVAEAAPLIIENCIEEKVRKTYINTRKRHLLFANCEDSENQNVAVVDVDELLVSKEEGQDPLQLCDESDSTLTIDLNDIPSEDTDVFDEVTETETIICVFDETNVKTQYLDEEKECEIKAEPVVYEETSDVDVKPDLADPENGESQTRVDVEDEKCDPGNKIVKKFLKRKKYRCIFCNCDVGHFGRHITRKHRDEKEVKAFCSLPKDNKQRLLALDILRKRGNFSRMSENVICPVRRPREEKSNIAFKPCPFCQGLYSAKYLYRHCVRCPCNDDLQSKVFSDLLRKCDSLSKKS